MIEFYQLAHKDQAQGVVVLFAEDTIAGILLRWVPNVQLWHRATEMENDYLFGDENGIYSRVTPDEVKILIKSVMPFDERSEVAQRILARYKDQPLSEKRTNEEMGLIRA